MRSSVRVSRGECEKLGFVRDRGSAKGRAARTRPALQRLTLTLDGIAAGDYLTWVRDPEPPALDLGLGSVSVRADPLGDTIEAVLSWDVLPPDPLEAAPAAGLPLTREVIAVESCQV